MLSRRYSSSADRIATTLAALSDCFAEPHCRRCEVLAICLQHLIEDAESCSSAPQVQGTLDRLEPFPPLRRRFSCQRCLPAEILSRYLTPGERIGESESDTQPPLSWLSGAQDMHW